jgi:hypothetical protein
MATTQFLSVSVQEPRAVRAALDSVVRNLCTSEIINGKYRVQMPVICSTGSMVEVSVWPEGNGSTFLVSDDGAAYWEVANGNFSARSFSRVAKLKCDRYGAVFDGQGLLFMRVTSDRLRGAIISMANLVKEVVDETIEHSLQAKHNNEIDQLFERLDAAFPKAHIEKRAQLSGSSTAVHEFAALVETSNGLLAFDVFNKSGPSLNAAFTKLSDVYRLENGPKPVGVTTNLAEVGPKLSLITSVASVIEVGFSIERYTRLAA